MSKIDLTPRGKKMAVVKMAMMLSQTHLFQFYRLKAKMGMQSDVFGLLKYLLYFTMQHFMFRLALQCSRTDSVSSEGVSEVVNNPEISDDVSHSDGKEFVPCN